MIRCFSAETRADPLRALRWSLFSLSASEPEAGSGSGFGSGGAKRSRPRARRLCASAREIPSFSVR